MRLTNSIKKELLEKAAHYIFDKRIEEAYRMAEEAMDKIVHLYTEKSSYKKNVDFYKKNKEYFHYKINKVIVTFFKNQRYCEHEKVPYSLLSKITELYLKREVESFVMPCTSDEFKNSSGGSYLLPEGRLIDRNKDFSTENWNKEFYERLNIIFEDEESRKEYSDIYIPIWIYCDNLHKDVFKVCNELSSIIKYIDNTTQLFTVLPNMAKLIPNVNIASGKINLEVNEEINSLLN